MKKIKFLYFVIFAVSIVVSKDCLAEEKKGFFINPFFREMNLDEENTEAGFPLEIANYTGSPVVFKLSVIDFGALDESGGVAFLGSSENQKYGLASWVSLEKDALALGPGEKQSISVTVKNRESLSPGGHYAAVVLKIDNEEKSESREFSKIALDPSFASLIFARKIGGEIYGLELREKEIKNNFVNIPASSKLRFQNTGNVHLIPRGVVKISDPLGRVVARGVINETSSIVLPETFRNFQVKIQKKMPIFIPGKYEVSFEYRFDGKDDFVLEKQKFDLMPLPAILTCLTVIGLPGGYFWFRKQKKRKREEKKRKISSMSGA